MNSKDANYDQFSNDASFDNIINEYIIFDPNEADVSPFIIEKNKSLNLNHLQTISLNEISSSDVFDMKDIKDIKYPLPQYSSATIEYDANELKPLALKRRKKHEIQDPFSDEEEEFKRINAIKAKSNRDRKKNQEEKRLEELNTIKKERDHLLLEKMLWEKEKKTWNEREKQWASEKEENSKRIDALVNIIQNLSKQKA